jgi:hypothetical protein
MVLTCMLLWVFLWLVEMTGRPRGAVCDCGMFLERGVRHLTTGWMGVSAVVQAVVSVGDTVGHGVGVTGLLWGIMAAHTGWMWWKHSRGGRRKLWDRVTGMVVDLGHRLAIAPVAGA